jgi:hypothetical protein
MAETGFKTDMNVNMILKCILEKLAERLWNGFIWLRVGSSKHFNEPPLSVRDLTLSD